MECIFCRCCSNYLLRYYLKENKDVRRRSCTVRYGASCIPLANRWQRTSEVCGSVDGPSLRRPVPSSFLSTIVLWFLMSFGWADGTFGMLVRKNSLNAVVFLLRSVHAIAWIFAFLLDGHRLARLEDGSCSCYRSDRKRERSSYIRYALFGFAEVAEDGAEIWGNLAAGHDSDCSIRLPGIQPSVCTLLRSYGCNQA